MNLKNIAISLSFISMIILGCSAMDAKTKNDKNTKKLSNYDYDKEVFLNRKPGIIEEMWKRNMSVKSIFSFLSKAKDLEPKNRLPENIPDLTEFSKRTEGVHSIWFGHSTFLLNFEGRMILIDPVFSDNASPVSLFVKRFQSPVVSLEDLPEIDYIVISHDHYDHLDKETTKFFKDKQVTFITPLGVGNHLKSWGIPTDRIIEKNWWESHDVDGLRFIATPAQHFSGRGLFDRNETLWASWVIQSESFNLYYSGDSGYDVHFKEIGDKLGPFDIAYVESGQYNEKWEEVHMMPKDSLHAYKDLRAKKYFPVHWGMFVLSKHAWNDPVLQLLDIAEAGTEFVIPKIGQVVKLNDEFSLSPWWK